MKITTFSLPDPPADTQQVAETSPAAPAAGRKPFSLSPDALGKVSARAESVPNALTIENHIIYNKKK
jgi:hypothetical protein